MIKLVQLLLAIIALCAAAPAAHALPHECYLLNVNPPYSRTFDATTQMEAERRFNADFGAEIRRTYGRHIKYLCVYPPTNLPTKTTEPDYEACPAVLPPWLATHPYGKALQAILQDCGNPLSRQGQYYLAVYSIGANRDCGFAPELNPLSMLGLSAVTIGTKAAYNEVYVEAENALKAEGCTSRTRAIAEGMVRHLKRIGDVRAERPFMSGCLQRTRMTATKCQCLADAVRLAEPQVFRLMYDGRKQAELINWYAPGYMIVVSAQCGVPPY